MKHLLIAFLAKAFLVAATLDVNAATYRYVGSWQVDQGPYWLEQPLAYSGQEAAALLFGGLPGEYAISTLGPNPETVNRLAWYSVFAVLGGGFQLADSLDQSLPLDLYYDGTLQANGLMSNPASAYVWDGALGPQYTNYAFRMSEVPLPATGLLLLGALGGLGLLRRRRGAI